MKRSVFIYRGSGPGRDSVWRAWLSRWEAGGQSLRLSVLPLLVMLLSLMMGTGAWATGLTIVVTGNAAGGTVTTTPTASTTYTTPAGGACAAPIAASVTGTTCTNATITGSVTLTAAVVVDTNPYVIWGGACAGLPQTTAAGTVAVTVSVPTSGAALTCSVAFPQTAVYDKSATFPQLPLSNTSCINFGYTAVGTTPAPSKNFGVTATTGTPAASITFTPSPDSIFQLGSTSGLAPVATAAGAVTVATATSNSVVAADVATAGVFGVTFNAPTSPPTLPYTVSGRTLNVFTTTDPAAAPIAIPIVGTIVQTIKPKIQVTDASGNVVINGTTVPYDLGTTTVGTPLSKTFTVKNVGYSNLTLTTPFSVAPGTGTTGNPFTATSPATTTLGFPPAPGCPGQTAAAAATPVTTTFDVTFDANTPVTAETVYTGTVTLTSDDNSVAGSKFTFPVKATVLPPPPTKPELDVLDETGKVIYSTTTTGTQAGTTTPIDFGSTPAGVAVTKKFTLKNLSTATVTTAGLVFPVPNDPTKPSPFSLTGILPTSIDPQSSKDITVSFSSTVAGAYNATFQLFNNDDDNSNVIQGDGKETPYTFPVTGTVTGGTVTPGKSTLKVSVVGTGSVTSSTPAGISSCTSANEATCTASFDPGTVTLTASGSATWSGGCTGSGSTATVTVVKDTPAACTATFTGGGTGTGTTSALTVTGVPTGVTLTSSPAGLTCTGTTCTGNFPAGPVTLTANPATGVTWGAGCPGGVVTVVANTPATCTVTAGTGGTGTGKSKLTVKVTGTGSVDNSNPAGISACTSANETTCSADFAAGDVTLTANPTTNVVWGSTCPAGKATLDGTNPVTCTVDFTGVVTPTTSKVTVAVTGTGTVKAPNTTLTNCTSAGGATCTADFKAGTVVELAATPTTGVTWGANCADGLITVAENTPTITCNVTFGTAPAEQVKLTITAPTNGTIIAGNTINCGTTCEDMFNKGDSVNVSAIPATNFTFTSWGGECSGTTNPLSLKLDVAKTCTATFTASGTGGTEPPPATTYPLTISTPTGGKVTSNTGGVNCGTSCTANFTSGSLVTLTATPDTGATFANWGGNCTGTTNPAMITMDAAKTCTATFTTGGGGTGNTCSATNLSACTTAEACTGVGGTFTNNTCTITPPDTTVCSITSLAGCKTEATCGSAGGVFINNTTCTIAPILTHPDKGTAAAISSTTVQGPDPTQFAAGVSVNGGTFLPTANVKATDIVEWAVNLTVNRAHINQVADILFVVGVEPPSTESVTGYTGGVSTTYSGFDVGLSLYPVNLYADAAGWPAELAKMTASPFKAKVTLKDKMSFNLRKGTLAALVNGLPRARVYTFVGYALADGTIVYNGMPIITTLE